MGGARALHVLTGHIACLLTSTQSAQGGSVRSHGSARTRGTLGGRTPGEVVLPRCKRAQPAAAMTNRWLSLLNAAISESIGPKAPATGLLRWNWRACAATMIMECGVGACKGVVAVPAAAGPAMCAAERLALLCATRARDLGWLAYARQACPGVTAGSAGLQVYWSVY